MIEPIIGFLTFFTIMFFVIRSANKSRSKQYEILTQSIKSETILFIEQAKSFTMTAGLKNRDFLFNRCDIYLIQDAIIILGFTKNSLLKQLSLPIIITHNAEYVSRFNFAYVRKPNNINFDNEQVKITFGEKGTLGTDVVIKLLGLTETQIAAMRSFVQKNC